MGAGRTRLLRTIFGLEPVKQRTDPRRRLFGAGCAARSLAAGHGHAQRGPQRRRAGRRAERRRQPDAVAPRRPRSRRCRCCRRARTPRPRGGSIGLASAALDPRQTVRELSGGNQQKVAVARLLHHDVDVLLLDEPTRGIDVASKAQIYRLIDELRRSARSRRGRRTARRPGACCWSAATCPSCSACAIASP